jgi:hypothetical protein
MRKQFHESPDKMKRLVSSPISFAVLVWISQYYNPGFSNFLYRKIDKILRQRFTIEFMQDPVNHTRKLNIIDRSLG